MSTGIAPQQQGQTEKLPWCVVSVDIRVDMHNLEAAHRHFWGWLFENPPDFGIRIYGFEHPSQTMAINHRFCYFMFLDPDKYSVVLYRL